MVKILGAGTGRSRPAYCLRKRGFLVRLLKIKGREGSADLLFFLYCGVEMTLGLWEAAF